MLRVAVTGGIGSGKSAFAEVLRGLGAQVSSSDEVGRRLMQPGEPVFGEIVDRFGSEVLSPDGTLDRPALARLAFALGRLEELNSIVHPAVIAAQAGWMASVASADRLAVAVVESALVFETKHADSKDAAPWRTRFDCIVLVTAPLEMRREHFLTRALQLDPAADRTSLAEDFDRRAAAQWTDERKAALSDIVIHNDGSLEALAAKAQSIYATLLQQSADRAAEAM